MSVDVERVREFSAGRMARMRNQHGFCETRSLDVPAIRFHRNVMLEQIAGLGAPVEAPAPLRLLRFQPPVHLPRANLQQFLRDPRPQSEAFADPWHHSQAIGPSAASTTDSQRPPIPLSARKEFPGYCSARAAAAAASRAAVRSASGWRTSGGTRCSRKIHPRLPSWPFAPPSGSAHKSPADTPIAPCSPTWWSPFLCFGWVTMVRRCPLRLHSRRRDSKGCYLPVERLESARRSSRQQNHRKSEESNVFRSQRADPAFPSARGSTQAPRTSLGRIYEIEIVGA